MPISVGIIGYEVEQHERVSALIAAVGGPVKAAALIKRTRQHLDNMRKPDARLSVEDLLPLCREAGVSLDWVATGYQQRPDLPQGEGVTGEVLRPLRQGPELVVPPLLLGGVPTFSARYATLDDNGMAPVLPRSALVIVDVRASTLKAGIYLIDLDGELVARRLHRLPDNKLELAADAEASWRFRFSPEAPPKLLHRVVWVGQNL
jgi:hypothetical protein